MSRKALEKTRKADLYCACGMTVQMIWNRERFTKSWTIAMGSEKVICE